ncbi:hypothetical protein [Parerythrobacter aestuarii]|uniref:hypothetical protein n=1 Tax=Parerythrobacter aestuarii TaxID=3020909 RepID=UPI0024DE8A67|nr:hypothetical protein [Parerythrobacter aestuarii]
MKTLISAIVLLLAAAPAWAKDAEGVANHTVAPAALQPDKAYLLFDSSRAKSGVMKITHVFMRVPTEPEIALYREAKRLAYEKALPKLKRKAKGGPVESFEEFQFSWDGVQNTFAVDMGKPLEESDTFLVEVPPGTYVLYGVAVSTRGLATCNCLGTVKFDAAPGTITRMGALFADKVHEDSPVPNLEDNLGKQMSQYGFVLGQALIPAKAGDPVPTAIEGLPSVLAEYHPVGMFAEPGAASVNRLAPIPGVLEYDRGRVVIPERAGE